MSTVCPLGQDRAIISSTMFRVKVDRDEPTQLHEQVAAEIRRAIADGEVKPGERLPPARDLPAVLGVNANTVLRALRELRDEGLLRFRRGRAITVAGTERDHRPGAGARAAGRPTWVRPERFAISSCLAGLDTKPGRVCRAAP